MRGFLAITLVLSTLASPLLAEPCFLAFPDDSQLTGGELVRSGIQRTFLSHIDGVVDVVVQPAFVGRLEDFGIVIPFPIAPVVRKVNSESLLGFDWLAGFESPVAAPATGYDVMHSETSDGVRVIRQEIVGMYEAATLAAGSSKALVEWLDSHSYRYPPAMAAACEEYIAKGWVFVAVKVDLAQRDTLLPQPGRINLDPALPSGVSYQGPIQAMGFRYRGESLVLPAKLASLNDREHMSSRIYVLSDTPGYFDYLGTEYVHAYIPGSELAESVEEIAKQVMVPGLLAVRGLLVSDLIAAETGDLGSTWISAMGPTTPEAPTARNADYRLRLLSRLRGFTLTVIEGQLPADVLRAHDLTFVPIGQAGLPSGGPAGWRRGLLILLIATSTTTLTLVAAYGIWPRQRRGRSRAV